MRESLVVELVDTLEREGIPRYAYQLQDYVDVEALERVIKTAPDDAQFHLTIGGIPVKITGEGVHIERGGETETADSEEGNWRERTSSSSPRHDIYEWTIDFLMKRLPADSVFIAEARDPHLVPVATGDEAGVDASSPEAIVASIPGRVYETDQSCNIPDLQDVRGATTAPQHTAADTGPRSFLAAPITDIGVITATSLEPSAFTETDEETLLAVSDLICTLLHEEELSKGPQYADVLDEMTDILSHDLVNKVTTAKGFLELAEQSTEPEYIAKSMESVTEIESMANMLVTLGRTGDPIEEITEIDVAESAKEVFRSLNGDQLRLLDSGIVLADPTCLERILHNVFQNAIDHGSEDVTVELGVLENGFYVADDGPAFPGEVIDTALEPGVSSRSGHHGLGLTIVKRLAEAHGWTVTILNPETGGARVEFTGVMISKST